MVPTVLWRLGKVAPERSKTSYHSMPATPWLAGLIPISWDEAKIQSRFFVYVLQQSENRIFRFSCSKPSAILNIL